MTITTEKKQLKISLLKGSFSPTETQQLIEEILKVKIKFHETKIDKSDEEETIKMRENRIIKLQNDLQALRKLCAETKTNILIDADIHFTSPDA